MGRLLMVLSSVYCRDPSLTTSTLMIVNSKSGELVTVVVAANDPIAEATISFVVTKDDPILLVQPIGNSVNNLNIGDGFIQLS